MGNCEVFWCQYWTTCEVTQEPNEVTFWRLIGRIPSSARTSGKGSWQQMEMARHSAPFLPLKRNYLEKWQKIWKKKLLKNLPSRWICSTSAIKALACTWRKENIQADILVQGRITAASIRMNKMFRQFFRSSNVFLGGGSAIDKIAIQGQTSVTLDQVGLSGTVTLSAGRTAS